MDLLANKKNANIIWKHLHCPIIWLSLDYNILDINKAALKIYEWRKKDVLGKNYSDLCKKNNFPCPIFRKNSLLLSDKTVNAAENVIKINKTEKTVLWDIECSYGDNKKIDGFVLVGQDVTKLKLEEDKNYQLDSIIARMPNNVYWYDKDFILVGCNENGAKTLGLPRKKAIGKSFDYFAKILSFPIMSTKKWKRELKYIIRTGIPSLDKEFTSLRDADGREISQLSSLVPLFDKKGNVAAVIGISVDITKQKQLERKLLAAKEKAEKANEAKSAFLAMMSHEFRTPLNGIFGIAQSLIQKDNLTMAQKKQLEIILISGNHLVSLINDILDFSKLEAGKLELNFEQFDLRLLVRETTMGLQHLFEENGLKLRIKYSDAVSNMVVADPKRIRQIIINLIGNAVKFTEKGGVTIAVEPGEDKNHIKLSVVDTGIGIPANKVNTIFERFSQIDADKYGRKYGGSGLGLAICKQLIAGMKGEIGVTSKLKKGSTFWLSLPLDLKASGKVSKKPEKTDAMRQIMSGGHRPLDKPCYLLLIEDNDINQMVAQLLFDDLGVRYDIASTGPEGLELFAKNKYDIICTDIGLPGMNGIEVIKNIRADKRGQKVPVVALTAHVMDEDEATFIDAGADDVLEKPIIFDTVKAMLQKWL